MNVTYIIRFNDPDYPLRFTIETDPPTENWSRLLYALDIAKTDAVAQRITVTIQEATKAKYEQMIAHFTAEVEAARLLNQTDKAEAIESLVEMFRGLI